MLQQASINLKKSDRKRLLEIVHRFKHAKILVIGDFILDQFVWGDVRRISPEAPVPVVNVKRESYIPGGSLNVANNIRSLEGTVYPCGILGRDLEGRMLIKAVRREGIETGGMIYDRSRPTSVKTRVIAHSQQVVRFDRENIDDVPRQDMQKILRFIRKQIAHIDVIIIEDYGKGLIQPSLLKVVMKLAKRFCKPVLVDPKEKHFNYYKGVTALTPNRSEAYAALENGMHTSRRHTRTVDQVGRALLKKMKCEAVLITLGEDGMELFEKKGGSTHIPTAAQEVYDVSGAGDTVIAVFGLALAVGATMQDAAVLSNLAAGIVVGKLGTATVQMQEMKAILEAA